MNFFKSNICAATISIVLLKPSSPLWFCKFHPPFFFLSLSSMTSPSPSSGIPNPADVHDGKSKSRTAVASQLHKLYMIDTTIKTREDTEHEKILLYHPAEIDLDTKTKDIGLAEGMVNFTKSFDPKKACETVRHKKHTAVFLEPEPDIWMVLSVLNPFVTSSEGRQLWAEDDLDPDVLRHALHHTYRIFRLFHGSFRAIMRRSSVEHLRQLLLEYYSALIPKLAVSQFSLLDSIDGIKFMPVDNQNFLAVQSAVNLMENAFPQINSSMFFYREYLVWSGFEQATSRILYSHFSALSTPSAAAAKPSPASSSTLPTFSSGGSSGVIRGSGSGTGISSTLLPASSTGSFRAGGGASPALPADGSSQSGFLSRPELLAACGLGNGSLLRAEAEEAEEPGPATPAQSLLSIPVYLGQEESAQHLSVYRHHNLLLVLRLVAPEQDQLLFFEKMQAFIKPRLSAIHQTLEEWMDKRAGVVSVEDSFRFIYFNSMNLALKSCLPFYQIHSDTLRILNRMHREFSERPDCISERVIQTRKHQWVVAKSSDQRCLYLLIDGPAESVFNLSQVDEHVQKLTSTVFGNIWW